MLATQPRNTAQADEDNETNRQPGLRERFRNWRRGKTKPLPPGTRQETLEPVEKDPKTKALDALADKILARLNIDELKHPRRAKRVRGLVHSVRDKVTDVEQHNELTVTREIVKARKASLIESITFSTNTKEFDATRSPLNEVYQNFLDNLEPSGPEFVSTPEFRRIWNELLIIRDALAGRSKTNLKVAEILAKRLRRIDKSTADKYAAVVAQLSLPRREQEEKAEEADGESAAPNKYVPTKAEPGELNYIG